MIIAGLIRSRGQISRDREGVALRHSCLLSVQCSEEMSHPDEIEREKERPNEDKTSSLHQHTINQHRPNHSPDAMEACCSKSIQPIIHNGTHLLLLLLLASAACCYVHFFLPSCMLLVVSLMMMVMNYFHSPSRFLLLHCFCIHLRSSFFIPYAASPFCFIVIIPPSSTVRFQQPPFTARPLTA